MTHRAFDAGMFLAEFVGIGDLRRRMRGMGNPDGNVCGTVIPEKRRLRRTASWFGVPLLLLGMASCTTFTPPRRGTEDLPLPETFTHYEPTVPSPDQWWETFRSEDLDRLVAETLRDNLSLQQTYARLKQAGAIAKQTRAARFPSLSFSGDASVSRKHTDTGESGTDLDNISQKLSALSTLVSPAQSTESTSALAAVQSTLQSAQSRLQALDTLLADPPSATSTTTVESYQSGLVASYELDLWGRLRAKDRAAWLEYDASVEDMHTAMCSLVAQVVLTWLDLLYYEQTLQVERQQLETNQTTLALIELRYRKGLSTALDVYQQRLAATQSRAAIPPLEASIQLLHHELAVLTGKPPRTDLALSCQDYPEMTPLPEPGLPAALLVQRPDVRAAGLMLQSADWQVSVALADRLPSIQLTASASYGANDWSLVFNNWVATLAGSITGPIIDAGRRKAEVERTRNVVEERLAVYSEKVLTAIKEVENALIQETKQHEYINELRVQLEVASAYHDQAIARYLKGLNDYLPVLGALTNRQTLERTLVQAEHDLLVCRVALHRSLGGTWTKETLPHREGASNDNKLS